MVSSDLRGPLGNNRRFCTVTAPWCDTSAFSSPLTSNELRTFTLQEGGREVAAAVLDRRVRSSAELLFRRRRPCYRRGFFPTGFGRAPLEDGRNVAAAVSSPPGSVELEAPIPREDDRNVAAVVSSPGSVKLRAAVHREDGRSIATVDFSPRGAVEILAMTAAMIPPCVFITTRFSQAHSSSSS